MARVAVQVTIKGDKEMLRKLRHLSGEQGMRKQARSALLEVGEPKLELMKSRTPVKTGKLLRSERLRVMVSPKKEDLRISLIAGGPDVPYAKRVHETHKTKSKFMESVLLEAAPTVGAEIAAKIDLRRAAGA
jgi:hypothetical protein